MTRSGAGAGGRALCRCCCYGPVVAARASRLLVPADGTPDAAAALGAGQAQTTGASLQSARWSCPSSAISTASSTSLRLVRGPGLRRTGSGGDR